MVRVSDESSDELPDLLKALPSKSWARGILVTGTGGTREAFRLLRAPLKLHHAVHAACV